MVFDWKDEMKLLFRGDEQGHEAVSSEGGDAGGERVCHSGS